MYTSSFYIDVYYISEDIIYPNILILHYHNNETKPFYLKEKYYSVQ